jgi:hypothetical protein
VCRRRGSSHVSAGSTWPRGRRLPTRAACPCPSGSPASAVRVPSGSRALTVLGAVADDHDERIGLKRLDRLEDPADQGPAGNLVGHLRQGRTHPLALAGSEDHDMCSQGNGLLPGAGGAGLEPTLTGPKPAVLPVTPPPTCVPVIPRTAYCVLRPSSTGKHRLTLIRSHCPGLGCPFGARGTRRGIRRRDEPPNQPRPGPRLRMRRTRSRRSQTP